MKQSSSSKLQYDVGLFIKQDFYQDQYSQLFPRLVPLKKLQYDVKIINNISTTTIIQQYFNEYNDKIEVEYFFPIISNTCFEHFEAECNGQLIKGIIKEKEESKQIYEDQKQMGNTVAYSQIVDIAPDVIKIDIGNIDPNSYITIRYTYSEELLVSMNKFWKFTIPSTITPRYGAGFDGNKADEKILQQMPQIKSDEEPYIWDVKISLKSNTPITFLRSTTHDLITVPLNDIKTEMQCSFDQTKDKQVPNKDFVLLFRNEQINVPSVSIGYNSKIKRFCAMVSFIPNFSNLQIEDAYKAQLDSNEQGDFIVKMDQAKGEFIFLLDRSGSMQGSRIQFAKDALLLFLKSLPPNSLFNVVSFGSNSEQLFNQSMPYNQENVDQAIEKIKYFNADMGGTNIQQPLATIFTQSRQPEYPRQLFLLTDGCVNNSQTIIQLIKDNVNTCRVHCIGLGSGASHYLVSQSAKSGKGNAIFIKDDDEDITGQIITLLERALSPCLDNFSFKYDDNIIQSIVPSPDQVPAILKNEPFTVFLFFNENITNINQLNTMIELTCYDSTLKKNLVYPVKISQEDIQQINDSVYKLAVNRQIKILLEKEISNNYLTKDQELQKQIVNLSIQNQILCQKTAFICIIKQLEDEKRAEQADKNQQMEVQFNPEKVIVPQVLSADYNSIYSQKVKKQQQVGIPKAGKHGRGNPYQKAMILEQQEQEQSMKTKSSTKINTVDAYQIELLMNILTQQKLAGFWVYSEEILGIIMIEKNKFFSTIPFELNEAYKNDKTLLHNIWITVFVLSWLDIKHQSKKAKWILIQRKSYEWFNSLQCFDMKYLEIAKICFK